jgi:hypothetical protein
MQNMYGQHRTLKRNAACNSLLIKPRFSGDESMTVTNVVEHNVCKTESMSTLAAAWLKPGSAGLDLQSPTSLSFTSKLISDISVDCNAAYS